ncbi:MAG TPA: helix-turn-helix domain-containing protein, partial [Polyangium sp.]|nr:helix-turn-helix domain-containing protein [Polyangium sp.]
ITLLEGYDFPGNVRDLRSAMLHAVTFCRDGLIDAEHLPLEMRAGERANRMERCAFVEPVPHASPPSKEEKEKILEALRISGGNHVRAAAMLKISKRTLYNRLNRYPDIPRPRKHWAEAMH